MSIVRDIEPWDALLDAGRADERLVREESQHARFPQIVALPDGAAPRRARGAARRAGSTPSGATRPRRWTPRGRRRRSSPPAPRRASRCASSSRRSSCSRATPRARALFLYPAKALAQDQARSLHALGVKRAQPAIYDGDTPREQRAGAAPPREPDPHQPRHAAPRDPPQPPGVGATSSANLAVVVIDEAHVYRGIFGSHVANVLRRLRRICELYGTSPRFLLASATIANPGELAARLTGFDDVHGDRPRRLARDEAHRSRCGTRRSPTRRSQGARSALAEAADLLAELVIEGARTIVFMKSRKARRADGAVRDARAAAPRAPEAGGADRALPRGLHAAAAARARAAAGRRRAARRRLHGRAGAGHRHRRARRGDLRDVPGDRRVAAPDVGPRGAARARARDLRRGRGRARPVLLPPPRRVPRAPGRGGDPRPRERAALRRAPAVRRARGAAGARRRRGARAALARGRRACWWARASCASAPTARSSRAAPTSTRRAPCRCAARAATRWRSSTSSPAR